METSERIATVDAIHEEARQQGLYFLHAEDEELCGPHIRVRGKALLAFVSCSYLGLEHHPELVAGVVRAVTLFGTLFSATRGFVSAPAYAEVEALMSELMGGHALVCSSTSLAHQAALGVLATEKDAIVLGHQAHHSIHQAAQLARTSGCHVEIVRHGELERALDAIRRLAAAHRTVWFAVDGVYSMYGDLVPIELVRDALELAPNVRLYVDDAHGMSWAGPNGRGSFLSRMVLCERIVLATSLCKAFAVGGACLVFATDQERQYVRKTGGPLFFSGPHQPPMLGAVMASARLHLSPAIHELQARLADRVALANRLIRSAGLPLLVENESPICFLRLGVPRLAFQVARRMMDDGIYVTPSVYPTVPDRTPALRRDPAVDHGGPQRRGGDPRRRSPRRACPRGARRGGADPRCPRSGVRQRAAGEGRLAGPTRRDLARDVRCAARGRPGTTHRAHPRRTAACRIRRRADRRALHVDPAHRQGPMELLARRRGVHQLGLPQPADHLADRGRVRRRPEQARAAPGRARAYRAVSPLRATAARRGRGTAAVARRAGPPVRALPGRGGQGHAHECVPVPRAPARRHAGVSGMGARDAPQRNCVYLQAQEDFQATVLREIAAEASLARVPSRESGASGTMPVSRACSPPGHGP